ncbi:hypothetical protein SCL_1921 [Sulfuricaulis limicola]|uniref:SseB protein N-terminal domain-containing protein n=1 Tax=Sulfuricaulis limicola TaxID=1620215 RepID=A0A1B4XHE3_9GAMM|nr:hypothetical protein SCL_1921 [Sulfuricaulis limicola]
MDLNTAVENPSLVHAMDRVVSENSTAAKDLLLLELQRANYLAAMLPDGEKPSIGIKPGRTVLKKGTHFGVLSAGKDGKNYLVLFSDWKALKAYTKLEVTGWVLPAHDAWSFALQGSTYDGVVINPAHNALPLERPMLEFLSKNAQSDLTIHSTGPARKAPQAGEFKR